jgi:hypothetical protein
MAHPRDIAQGDMDYWSSLDPRPMLISGPNEVEAGITPCPALITGSDGDVFGSVVRVPWVLDEIELAHLAQGGTLWLSTWGGLPIHMIEVAAP